MCSVEFSTYSSCFKNMLFWDYLAPDRFYICQKVVLLSLWEEDNKKQPLLTHLQLLSEVTNSFSLIIVTRFPISIWFSSEILPTESSAIIMSVISPQLLSPDDSCYPVLPVCCCSCPEETLSVSNRSVCPPTKYWFFFFFFKRNNSVGGQLTWLV